MADKPTPDEELPPTERFERLVNGPEPEVFGSVHEDHPANDEEEREESVEPDSADDSKDPPAVEADQSVLERFDALKQRLQSTSVPPTPPPTPEPETAKSPAPEAPPATSPPDNPLFGELDARIRPAGRLERETPAELDTAPATPSEPAPDVPTSDDLEQIKLQEAKERRLAGRKAKRKSRRQSRSFWKELPILIVISVVVAIIIKTFFFQAFYIPSASMVDTLEVNDRVLVNKLSYRFGAIERGDILVFDSPEAVEVERSLVQRIVRRVGEATGLVSPDTVLIKRVIGLPGETVEVRDNQVYVNDSPIAEPYLAGGVTTRDMDPEMVPADHVFMMGDNRNQSRDSRAFGPIERDEIVGRAFVRVWPATRWGGL